MVLETDVPGHSTAWSLAVPEVFVTCPSPGINQDFGGVERVLDPTLDATWAFLDAFIGELSKRFPDRYLHLGGDEVRAVRRSIPNRRGSIRFRPAPRTYAPHAMGVHRTCGEPGETTENTHPKNVTALFRDRDHDRDRDRDRDQVNVACFNASASVRRWMAERGPVKRVVK